MQVLINGLDSLMDFLLPNLTASTVCCACRVFGFFRIRGKMGCDRIIVLNYFLSWKVIFAILVLRIFLNSEGKQWGFLDQLPVCAQMVALMCLLATDFWCRLSLPYGIQWSKWKTRRCPFGKEVNMIMKLNTVVHVFFSRLSARLSWTKSHFFCFTKVDMK